MKKVLSIFLCAVMLLGSFSLFASATEAPAAVDARTIGEVYGQKQLYMDKVASQRHTGYISSWDCKVTPHEYPVSYTVTAEDLNGDVAATGIEGWTISLGLDSKYLYWAAEVIDPKGLTATPNGKVADGAANASSFRIYLAIANGGDFHDVHSYFYTQHTAFVNSPSDRLGNVGSYWATGVETAYPYVSKDGTAAPVWGTNYSTSGQIACQTAKVGDIVTYEGRIEVAALYAMFGVSSIDALTVYGESVTRGTTDNPTGTAEVRLNDKVNIPQHVCDSIDAYYGAKEPARTYKGAGKWLPRATAWVVVDDLVVDNWHEDFSGWGQEYYYADPSLANTVTGDGVVSAGEYTSVQDFDLTKIFRDSSIGNSYEHKYLGAAAGLRSWKNYFSYNEGVLYLATVVDYDYVTQWGTNPLEGIPAEKTFTGTFSENTNNVTHFGFSFAPVTGPKNVISDTVETYDYTFVLGFGDETNNLGQNRGGKATFASGAISRAYTDEFNSALIHSKAGYDNGITTVEIAVDLNVLLGSAPEAISFFNTIHAPAMSPEAGYVYTTQQAGPQATNIYNIYGRWLAANFAQNGQTHNNVSHTLFLKNETVDMTNAIVTKDAASIRLGNDGHNGLRFTSVVDYALFDKLVAMYGRENITVGHLIAPESYVNEAGEFTKDALDALGKKVAYRDVVTDSFLKNDQGNYVFAGSLVDILDQNLDRNFAAIGYIQIGDGEIIYSSSYTVRNVSDIAAAALTDVQAEQCADYCYAVAGEDTYSPYDTEQRKFLADLVKAN